VVRLDGVPPFNSFRNLTTFGRTQLAVAQADMVVYQSEWSQKAWKRRLLRTNRSAVIYNGVPYDPDVAWQRRPNAASVQFVAAIHLRYVEQIQPFLTFMAARAARGNTDTLNVYGSVSPEVRSLLQGHRRVAFGGMLHHGQLREVLLQHDVFVYLNSRGTCPNSILEAMSIGMPLLVPRVEGIGELVNDYPSFDWPPTPETLERTFSDVLAASERLAPAVKTRVATNFNIALVAKQYKRILEQASQRRA